MNPTRQASRLIKAIEGMGLACERRKSRSSEAEYLYVTGADGDTVKVRLAAHAGRPTHEKQFGAPDYELAKGQGHDFAEADDAACVRWLAERFAVTPPARTDPDRREAASAAARKASRTRNQRRQDAEEAITRELVVAWRGQPGALPAANRLLAGYDVTQTAARRIRAEVQNRRKIGSVAVIHDPITMADRPKGHPRSHWQTLVDLPWVVHLGDSERVDGPGRRYPTRETAESAADDWREKLCLDADTE